MGLFITEKPRGMLAIREGERSLESSCKSQTATPIRTASCKAHTQPAVRSGGPGLLSWLKLLQLRCVQTARKFCPPNSPSY